jgi:putative membrane protein
MADSARSTPKAKLERSAAKLHDTSRKLEDSSEEIRHSTGRIESSADRTTQLAANRTVMAAERTYLAWVRTGLFSLASGLGTHSLLTGILPRWLIIVTGSVLVLFSAFCFAAAVWRQANPGPPPPVPDTSPIWPVILIAVNGFLALVSLAALVEIWLGPATFG